MELQTHTQDLMPLGDSGIFVDQERLAANIQRWVEDTPYEVKRQQIETFATTGILALAGLLFALALTRSL